MVYSNVKPRHVVCVLGEWDSLGPVEKIVSEFGNGFSLDREYSLVGHDDRMTSSFSVAMDRVAPTLLEEDWVRIEKHNTVSYLLSPPIEADQALAISAAALALIERLVQGGATAVKSESAGVAHGLDEWLRLARTKALRQAWVRRPIEDDGVLYSCGMHLLGLPDVECVGGFPDREAVVWMDAVADAALAGRTLAHEFSMDDHSPARKMKSVSCERYADDDFFFNPYGYVRLAA